MKHFIVAHLIRTTIFLSTCLLLLSNLHSMRPAAAAAAISTATKQNLDAQLFKAVNDNNYTLARNLLSQGATVDAQSPQEYTPLHVASENRDHKIVELLLIHHAKVNAQDGEGMTPLHIASLNGDHKIVELLLIHHADVNAQDDEGMTPLHIASLNGDHKIVKLLLAKNPTVDAQNLLQWTPLHLASQYRHTKIVELLLTKNANVDAQNPKGVTPLHLASLNEHTEIVKLLLAKNANINTQNSEGMTPLHFASGNGYPEIVRLLLAQNANVITQNSEGVTPLHFASLNGHTEIVRLLLAQNANVNAQTNLQYTPLSFALAMKHNEIVKLLNKELAKTAILNNDTQFQHKKNPLFTAIDNNLHECVDHFAKNQNTFRELFNQSTPNQPNAAQYALDNYIDNNLQNNVEALRTTMRIISYAIDFELSDQLMFLFDTTKLKKGTPKTIFIPQYASTITDFLSKNFQGICLIHRAIRAGALDLVQKILAIDKNQTTIQAPGIDDDNDPHKNLSPICFLIHVQDPIIKMQLAALLKDNGAQLNDIARDYLRRNNAQDIIQIFEGALAAYAGPSPQKLMQQQEADAKMQVAQEQFTALSTILEQQELEARRIITATHTNELTQTLMLTYQEQENANRTALQQDFYAGRNNLQNNYYALQQTALSEQERIAREIIEQDGETSMQNFDAVFQVGSARHKQELMQARQEIAELYASQQASASDSTNSTPSNGSQFSLQSRSTGDDSACTLCLTPRRQSTVSMVVGQDRMAINPGSIRFSENTQTHLHNICQIDRILEGQRMPPYEPSTRLISCDQRVNCFRTSSIRQAIDSETGEFSPENNSVSERNNEDRISHALTTELLIKVLQAGSVYLSLEPQENDQPKMKILIVASLPQYQYSEEVIRRNGGRPKNIPTWITLCFSVQEPFELASPGGIVRLGDIVHFCTQPNHPRFSKNNNQTSKYFLTPIHGIEARIDSSGILIFSCPKNTLTQTLGALRRTIAEETYEQQWVAPTIS